ncbi:MAG: hypothetical protein MK202_03315 [Tenacibaculum sp.]|nr:hypothetical protein [Tenacibaculum sp.]
MKKLIYNLIVFFAILSCSNKQPNKVFHKIRFEYKDKHVITVTDYEFLLEKETENVYLFINDSIQRNVIRTKKGLSNYQLKIKDSVYDGFIESLFLKKEINNQFALLTDIISRTPIVNRYKDKDVFIIGSVKRLEYFIDNDIIEFNN